jgi:hypothetical protein
MSFPQPPMERITFFAASAAFCLFLTVALTSAMSTDEERVTLPGDTAAWQQQHDDFHHRWTEMEREFNVHPRSDKEKREFNDQMEEAHRLFHAMNDEQGVPLAQ